MIPDILHTFEDHRSFLTALARKIAGNWADAEDLVNHAALRAQNLDLSTVQNPKALLATMVTRMAINHVNSARVRREIVLTPEDLVLADATMREESNDLGDALGHALDVVFSRLSPIERTVFLLREVFQFEYAEIAGLLNETEANCRQMLKRGREKLAAAEPRFRVEAAQRELALERFLSASRDGNLDDLLETVAPDVILVRDPSDAGMPQPPPIVSRPSVFSHVRAYLTAHPRIAWASHVVGNRYDIAIAGEGEAPRAVFICRHRNGVIERIDQITCPKRVRTLCQLFCYSGATN